jgi:hypothetical protein
MILDHVATATPAPRALPVLRAPWLALRRGRVRHRAARAAALFPGPWPHHLSSLRGRRAQPYHAPDGLRGDGRGRDRRRPRPLRAACRVSRRTVPTADQRL